MLNLINIILYHYYFIIKNDSFTALKHLNRLSNNKKDFLCCYYKIFELFYSNQEYNAIIKLDELVFSEADEIETYEYLIAYCFDEDGSYDFGKRIKNNEENIASFIVNNREYNCVLTDPSDRLVVSSIKGVIDEGKSCVEYANKSLKLTCLAMLNDEQLTPKTEFFEEKQKVSL